MPAIAELAPMFALLMLVCACMLTLQGYRFTLRPVIQGLAWLVSHFAVAVPIIGRIGPGPWLAKQLKALDRSILHALSYGIERGEHYLAALWHGFAREMEWMAEEIYGLGTDVVGAFARLKGVAFPDLRKIVRRLIAASVGAAYRQLLKLLGIAAHGLGKRLILVVRKIVGLERWAKSIVGRTAKQVRAMLRRLGKLGWLAGVASVAALGHLIFRRLKLGWLLGHRSAAGLVAVALAKLGLSWVRCGNVGKAGKAICKTDADWLDELLLGALAIAGTISVVEFAEDVQKIEDEAVGILKGFIREL